jgi:hypothetical protein
MQALWHNTAKGVVEVPILRFPAIEQPLIGSMALDFLLRLPLFYLPIWPGLLPLVSLVTIFSGNISQTFANGAI